MGFMAAGLAGGSDIPAGYDVGKLSAQDILGRRYNRNRICCAPPPIPGTIINYSARVNLADISFLGSAFSSLGAFSTGFA